MYVLNQISIYLFAFSFLLKVIFHAILDYHKKNKFTFGSGMAVPIEYFLPYNENVHTSNMRFKRICNFLYYFSLCGFVIWASVYLLNKL